MKLESAQTLMQENLLVKHYAGSIAYGTNLPDSDVDFRGIFCANPINLLTPFFPIREVTDKSEEDTKYYELAHFLKLCLDCNPNIVETLWVDDDSIVTRTKAYDFLRGFRYDFLSSKIAFTTSGYAMSQLKRIKGHNKWINNPQPKEKPVPKEFVSVIQRYQEGFDKHFQLWNADHRLIPYGNGIYAVHYEKGYTLFNDQGGLNTNFEGNRSDYSIPAGIVKFNKEEYRTAKEKHEQYWDWKNNRNKKRSKLEEKYQMDTKHAMHLVRLLKIGLEALRDGEIIVKRPDAQELLDIRNGSMSYAELIEYATHMDNEVRNVWYKKTDLPKKPDIKKAAQVLMEVQKMVWEK